ncbi:MAG: class I SAM-dependent methyltransferase [Emcibacter sp.]|nr:class I SAM-dependent methyltransferase [Emcibacter sp.]
MLPEKNQFVYDLAMDVLGGAAVTVPQVPGFSERIIEVPQAAYWLNKFTAGGSCKILDIGYTMSSLDWMGLLLKLNAQDTCRVSAMDIIKPERVQSRYPKDWLEAIFQVPVEIGDLRTMPMPEGEFDVVTCISTIEHIGFDEAEEEDSSTAFKRSEDETLVRLNRADDVNSIVLAQFHKALKAGGHVIITAPMGKGGAVLLKDSLGLFTRQWEYETDSWHDLMHQQGFEVVTESFYGLGDSGLWAKVGRPSDLREKTSELQPHAHGCAFAVLKKI